MTANFYDELAPFYHLLYADWEAAIRSQGSALAALLNSHAVAPGSHVLDAACGIGTQSLGLAALGYVVTASDVSAGALARLEGEAAGRGLRLATRIDDLRSLANARDASFDAILACDNSLPHLLSEAELLDAFRSALRVLRPNGAAIYSVRDYAEIPRNASEVRPYPVRYEGQSRFLAIQLWEWQGDQYDLRMYLTHEAPDGRCETRSLVTRYYAVTIERLMALMQQAGFALIERRDDVLFQPVIVGHK
jgi:SAM-dependent methyltransferase